MASYRVNAAGEVEIPASRRKSVTVLVLLPAGVAVCAWALTEDTSLWWAWLGIPLCGGLGAVFAYRQLRLGLLRGNPALVLGPDGLWDRVTGFRVRWDEVEKLELWEKRVRSVPQRYLGLEVRDPDAVYEQIGGMRGAMHRFGVPGRPPFNVSINPLAVSPEEFVELLRRFWRGPVHGEVSGPSRSLLARILG